MCFMNYFSQCSVCGNDCSRIVLAESNWYPFWNRDDGACPACVRQNLLRTLLAKGDAALHEAIQMAWPLDAEAALGPCQQRWRRYYRTETDYATLPALEGTSFAAPIVASAIACLLETNPSLTSLLIRDVLRETALPSNRRQWTGAALRET